jgi:phosphonate metabolism-associated iron-containing alcohol dehydrogenase
MIFHNPVQVEWGTPDFEWLPALIRGRHAAVVSTKGMEERGIIERVAALINQANLPVVSTVHPNPTVASIREHAAKLLEARDVEVIVAIGGGSVMDTAKGIAAIASGGFSADWFASHLREGAEFPTAFAPPAVIAVPTTAGTGSEVTMWGTVWDEETGAKYSISHPKLYAERAVLVPELTATMPPDLTLYSALDALSHCMESIWNRNTNAVSEAFATAGLAKILPNLDNVLRNPDDFEARRRLQEAALLGGLAISCTKTALAHSISYPLTSRLGMPHGLACGFTLPELMRFNADTAPDYVLPIMYAMDADTVNTAQVRLTRFFSEWDVRKHVSRYLDEEKARAMENDLLTPGRAENNVRHASHADALGVVLRSL